MNAPIRDLALLAFGYLLLVLQTTVLAPVFVPPFTPNLLLPLVVFVGVVQDLPIARGAVMAFFLGYLMDLFGGSSMSVQTFLFVALFLLARGAGLRLFLRNPGFQFMLTFVLALLLAAATLALRAIFGQPPAFASGNALGAARGLLLPAVTTALAAPLVFPLTQRLWTALGRRREEAAAP
ncbi:MAG: rod shape-determining protein MreD [Myxococcota bacterium]